MDFIALFAGRIPLGSVSIKLLDGRFSVHHDNNRLSVFGMALPVDDEDILFPDTFIDHGFPLNPQGKRFTISQKAFRNLDGFRDFDRFNRRTGGNNAEKRDGGRSVRSGRSSRARFRLFHGLLRYPRRSNCLRCFATALRDLNPSDAEYPRRMANVRSGDVIPNEVVNPLLCRRKIHNRPRWFMMLVFSFSPRRWREMKHDSRNTNDVSLTHGKALKNTIGV